MSIEEQELRCPRCGKKVAVILSDGSVEVRHAGNLLVQIIHGSVNCPRCRALVARVEAAIGSQEFRTLT